MFLLCLISITFSPLFILKPYWNKRVHSAGLWHFLSKSSIDPIMILPKPRLMWMHEFQPKTSNNARSLFIYIKTQPE